MKNQRTSLLLVGFLFAISFSCFSQALQFSGVSEVKPLKRGKLYNIKWSGGPKDQSIKIELHNATGIVQSWDETLNDGEHGVRLKSKLKPGDDYSFKILAGNEWVSAQNVRIKRRIPFVLIVSTIVVVPVAVLLLSAQHPVPPIEQPK